MIATILILSAAACCVFWCVWHWEEWAEECDGEAKRQSQGLK